MKRAVAGLLAAIALAARADPVAFGLFGDMPYNDWERRQVVLVHGDTHYFRIDLPLRDPRSGETIRNFTRVETYGSPTMGWVHGMVDAADPQVFRFEARPYLPQ